MASLRKPALPRRFVDVRPDDRCGYPELGLWRVAILVLGSAMTWSVHETSPAPPPSATPRTAAIVKHGCDQEPWNSLSSLSESALFSSGVCPAPRASC